MDDGVEPAASREGQRGPAVPLFLVVISLVVAVGAVSILILVLFRSTTGPGQTLREYYKAVSAGDCDAAYGLLSSPLRDGTDREDFCETVEQAVSDGVPNDVVIQVVTGFGEPPARFARVTVEERGRNASTEQITWRMAREGGDWFVDRFATTGRCPVDPGVAAGCVPL